MARILQVFLHIHRRIAKRRAGLGPCHGHSIDQGGFGVRHAHAAAAAPACCLDDDRIPDLLGDALELHRIIGKLAFRTRHTRYARLDHGLFGRNLVTHDADGIRARADEGEPAFLHALGEIGVFGQKAIAGMDGLGVGHLGCRDDGRHVEIALRRRRRTDADGLVGKLDVFGFTIRFGINHYRPDAHFFAGALDAQGDFSPVGDQYFFEHGSLRGSITPRIVERAGHLPGLACGKNTALGNQYLEHKQSGRPTRGSTPATARMRPMTHSMMNNAWPYSTASPLPQRICFTVPATSVSISLRIFMASMMHTVWPALTVLPTSTNGAAPGLLAR